MREYLRSIVLTCLFISFSLSIVAQKEWTISLITENPHTDSEFSWFEEKIQEEINLLLKNRVAIDFKVEHTAYDIAQMQDAYKTAYSDPSVDIVISL